MPISVTCPTCNATLRIPDTAAGKKIKCPKCEGVIPVPEVSAPPVETPVTRVPPPLREDDDRPSRRHDEDDDRPRRRWRSRDDGAEAGSSGSNGVSIGLGIGAIALGLIAAIFAFVPCCGAVVAWPAGGIGLLLGLIGVLVCVLAKQKSTAAMILTIAGSLVNVAALAISVVWLVWAGAMFSTGMSQVEKQLDQQKKQQQNKEQQIRTDKETSRNNLKQLGAAMHLYHDAHRHFPNPNGNNAAAKGKLSWRVAILPFLGSREGGILYAKLHPDEAWDSPHNKKILDTEPMPTVFKAPRGSPEGNKTYYQVFTGPKTIWPNELTKARLTDITDGTSNTFLIVEAQSPVYWTQPQDLPFNGFDVPPVGGVFSGDFHAVTADGTVYFVDRTRVSAVTIVGAITATGGEILGNDWPPQQ